MRSRVGQAILALIIVGGTCAAIYSITRSGSEVTADDNRSDPNKLNVAPMPVYNEWTLTSREELNTALDILFDPLDVAALEKECDKLIEKLQPNEKLTAPDDVLTLKELRQRELSHRHIVAEYRENSSDPPAIRDEAIELISLLARQWMNVDAKRDNTDTCARLNELYEAGTQNPVIRWAVLRDSGTVEEKHEFVHTLRDVESSNRFKLDVLGQYISKHFIAYGNRPEMFHHYVEVLATELSSFDPETDDVRAVFSSYLNQHLMIRKEVRLWTLTEWSKTKPDIHPLFLHFLAGDAAKEMAWITRGTGWASEVTEWEAFEEDIEAARQHYLKAWTLAPDDPVAPSRLISVVLSASQARRSPREWFNIATTIEFSFGPAYGNYVPSLLPRWGGSDEQMYAFVRECFDTNAPQTFVPWQGMSQLKWWLKREKGLERDFLLYSLDMTDLLLFIADRLAAWDEEYDSETLIVREIREWTVSVLLLNRMFLEAAPLTRNFAETIRPEMISEGNGPVFCLQATRALDGKNASELDDLEQRFVEPFAEFSPSELETWQAEVRKRAGSVQAPYLKTREEFIRVQTQLTLGKEAQLYCNTPARCWKDNRCELVQADQNSFEVKPLRERARWSLASRIPFRPPYTFKAMIERVGEPDGDASLLLAERPYDPATLPQPSRKFVRDAVFDLPKGNKLDVEMRVTDKSVTCLVNGESVQGDVDRVADSLTVWFESQQTLRISNIRVQCDTTAGSP